MLQISTVHGNASLDRVTYNALSILTSINRTSIPVYAGCRKPFMRPAVHAPDIHGSSGIDGTNLLPEPTASPNPGNAIMAMREAIMATPLHTCLLVATGTLTNVALLLATFPEVAAHLKEVSIMGGAFRERPDACGNITPTAEFNIYCDPEAAHSVLTHPALDGRVTLVPLDLTHTVLATEEVLARLLNRGEDGKPPGGFRRMLFELLTYFSATYARVFDITAGPPLHDPLAVAAVLPTDEVEWEMEKVRVNVVCHGDEVGKTVKTLEEPPAVGAGLGGEGKDPYTVVRVTKKVDVDAFWKLLLDMVEKAEGRYTWLEEEVLPN
ncbi:Inosine/uridine-preferring nucleoside hydrolase domain-containing protein [Sphaerosporella brunnea]|uniref:Inosine/uridine-preferring nucleoside hydrolase domain-containing protein n=1 Tax=Sphaerosporella brunnea TaxID=1250544 RepID=A0A5J5F767_9PEZI|nr:Inosine/uridine-preferring nucleoside hydrolase domain-containing protein [Sphaerosporella brunnea]